MLETQTIIAVAVIGAIAAGLVNVIKAMFSRNQSKDSEYEHLESCLKIVMDTNKAIEEQNIQLGRISEKLDTLENRLDKLEEKINERY